MESEASQAAAVGDEELKVEGVFRSWVDVHRLRHFVRPALGLAITTTANVDRPAAQATERTLNFPRASPTGIAVSARPTCRYREILTRPLRIYKFRRSPGWTTMVRA